MDCYNIEQEDLLKNLRTSSNGLSEKEAAKRLKEKGLNEIKEIKKFKLLKILLKQFVDPFVFILIFAVIISTIIADFIDAIVIGAILVLNTLLGFWQEFKAEKAIKLLKQLSAIKSGVIRGGVKKKISSKELVPGDVIIIEPGDKISADARLISTSHLLIDESVLTGESIPVEKNCDVIESKKVALADQLNMVFSGTLVHDGRGVGVIVDTGKSSELGKIAKLVEEEEKVKTPLQKRLNKLSKYITVFVVVFVSLVFLIGIKYNDVDFYKMFLMSLSLAVSAIPEGLPAVITITLALSVRTMLKRKALIRKLKSIETLGSITAICSDKTGTLTKNEMTVNELFVNNKNIKVSGEGYKIKGNFYFNKKIIDSKPFKLLLEIGAYCNNASLPNVGDPTELALLVSAAKSGIKQKFERLDETIFNSKLKYMSTTYKVEGKVVDYIKGAPEKILDICNYIKIDGKVRKLSDEDATLILNENKRMADKALRVLAMGYKEDHKAVFVGLQGMRDPPRKEAKNAIALCRKAGIKVYMITGDNKDTAVAIAKQIGITGKSMVGKELEHLDLEGIRKVVKDVCIFARVNPEHKVNILKALQANKEIVGMTGDGVNDAPALKRADVGISMAIKGTDIARDASDIVLLDDNFSSIVKAIKEGRVIYSNIKKFLKFLLSVNFSQIFVVIFALFSKLPLPFLPLQILWLNLITDSLPALALSKEKGDVNIMEKNPRNPNEGILKGLYFYIIVGGIIAFIAILFVFLYTLNGDLDRSRTMAVTTSVIFEMFFVFSCKSNNSLKESNLFSNKYLIGAVCLSILLHVIVMYTPFSSLFGFTALSLKDWSIVLLLGSTGFIFFEVKKLIQSFKSR